MKEYYTTLIKKHLTHCNNAARIYFKTLTMHSVFPLTFFFRILPFDSPENIENIEKKRVKSTDSRNGVF